MGFKSRANYNLSEQVLEDENYVFKGIGSPGTTYLANTELCLHRAGTPKIGHHRDVIQIRFQRSKKPILDDWINNIEHDDIDIKKFGLATKS